MKLYKKKWLLEIRRISSMQSHQQRKRRIEGKCYYKWRNYNKAFDKLMIHYQTSLLEAFAIPATEEDELARFLIVDAAIKRKENEGEADEQERSI